MEELEVKKDIRFLELNIKVSVLEKLLLDNKIIDRETYESLCKELIGQIVKQFADNIQKAKDAANA